MPEVKLSAALPKGQHNGLLSQHTKLSTPEAEDPIVCVALVARKRLIHDDDKHSNIPELRVVRIEPITDPDDAKGMLRLLLRAFEARTGQPVLPLDMETELDDMWKQVAAEGDPPPEGDSGDGQADDG